MKEEQTSFPLLLSAGSPRDWEELGCPKEVPWGFVEPHDIQARRNHGGQTLQELARRGGLSPAELLCVVTRRHWTAMHAWGDAPHEYAVPELLRLLEVWERSQ